MRKFDPSIPRRMYWSDALRDKRHCPECRSELENEPHEFVMAVRYANESHPFIVGNDAGYFCPKCPIVVLDSEEFDDFAARAFGSDPRAQYAVVGSVDLAAVPEEKRSMPFGEDNPVPLVRFLARPGSAGNPSGNPKPKGKRKKKRRGAGKHR